MFKKLKQRIEDGDTTQSSSPLPSSSTPKKQSRPTMQSYMNRSKHDLSKNINSSPTTKSQISANKSYKVSKENKWEKRRKSSTSSRESLLSIDSSATASISRISYHRNESSHSTIGTPVETPLILDRFREIGSKDEVLSALAKKSEQVNKLESKINEMALAYMEQTKQRDRLEEALQNLRNEMNGRGESSFNDTLSSVKEEYEKKLHEKDKLLRESLYRHEEEKNRTSDIKELNELQRDEVAKMKAMLIHAQTEKSRKTAELMEKSKKIEDLDKQYMEQKLELEEMQERLDDLTRDRTKHEMKEEQAIMEMESLRKEKAALKSQLSELISELTQKSSLLETVQLTADRSRDEVTSLRQTYNLYKTKTSTELSEKDATIEVLKEKIGDLEQRLNDATLCENDQIKALEKERALLEKRLQDTREELTQLKSQSNDKITTMGTLVATLDEKLKEKAESCELLQKEHQTQYQHYEKRINEINEKLAISEETSRKLKLESNHAQNLQKKIKELDQKCSALKTEKMELEIHADKASFLESQNKLLDTRFKETVERLEHDRSSLEEKVKELQGELRKKSSYRSENGSKRKIEHLETKVEDQARIIDEYRDEIKALKNEKEILIQDLSLKENECQEVASCLEEAILKTNDLKKEISTLQDNLHEKEDLISYIKDSGEIATSAEVPCMDSLLKEEITSLREMFDSREQDIQERDDEIEELRNVIQCRDDELATVSKKLMEFEDNNRMSRRSKHPSEKEFQRTIARLTSRIQELELQQSEDPVDSEIEIENRSLKAELDENHQKTKQLQQVISDLKRQYQKQMKEASSKADTDLTHKANSNGDNKEYLEVNFKYLKHVILKYMCSTNEQSRQLVGVIGHLLQFTPRESSIVIDCFEWKLPLEK